MTKRLPIYFDWARWLAWAVEFDKTGNNTDKVCFTMGSSYLISRMRAPTWR